MEPHLRSPLHQLVVQRGDPLGRSSSKPFFFRVNDQIVESIGFSALGQCECSAKMIPMKGRQPYILPKFSEKATKLKEFWSIGGRRIPEIFLYRSHGSANARSITVEMY